MDKDFLEDIVAYIVKSAKDGIKPDKVLRNVSHDIQLKLYELEDGTPRTTRYLTQDYRNMI